VGLDLEASEMGIRESMHRIGGVLLEGLVNGESERCGMPVKCDLGHDASFVSYRSKQVVTVLSPIEVRRAYYHCVECKNGVIPKDQALDIVGTGFSPGTRRMMARVGGKEPFDEGRQDMEELAGIKIKTKEIERVAEATGEEVERLAEKEQEAVMSGKMVSIRKVPKMYVAIDGTGVPVVAREAVGRRGKGENGELKTREAKLGCLFTQTRQDEKGRPVRDPESTTYVGAIETSEEFGPRIYAEAVRRGHEGATQLIVLGDGAPWIWSIADEHFPGAIQIVDLYHAREHLNDLGKALFGAKSVEEKRWVSASIELLDNGEIESLVARLQRLRPGNSEGKEAARKQINYFTRNKERMRYAQFRCQGLFVGSGVVEAGCKTLIGRRLKQSGMRWTVRGANAIIALRCSDLSGRWEQFWENRRIAS
jgi:hypothetical protein